MTQTTTATDHAPVTVLQVELARERAAKAAEDYRVLSKYSGPVNDEVATRIGEAKALAEGAATHLARLLEIREAQEAVVTARLAREDDAKAEISRLNEQLTASGDRLVELANTADAVLLELARHAGQHDALVVQAQEMLRGHQLLEMPGHEFGSLTTDRGARLHGRMWTRLDVAGVLARCMQRVTRAALPRANALTLRAEGIARGYTSRLPADLFGKTPDLGVCAQPPIVRPRPADIRVA